MRRGPASAACVCCRGLLSGMCDITHFVSHVSPCTAIAGSQHGCGHRYSLVGLFLTDIGAVHATEHMPDVMDAT